SFSSSILKSSLVIPGAATSTMKDSSVSWMFTAGMLVPILLTLVVPPNQSALNISSKTEGSQVSGVLLIRFIFLLFFVRLLVFPRYRQIKYQGAFCAIMAYIAILFMSICQLG